MTNTFFRTFETRWSDLDANRHLANSAYINFMSHTRMSFLESRGFGHKELEAHRLGPVVLHEKIYYFREILPGTVVRVTAELLGVSADESLFQFGHRFYDESGSNKAFGKMMGAWISLDHRRITSPPDIIGKLFDGLSQNESCKILTKDDIREQGIRPIDL